MGSDETLLYSPWEYLAVMLLLIKENAVFELSFFSLLLQISRPKLCDFCQFCSLAAHMYVSNCELR